jgi:hypothetical protein
MQSYELVARNSAVLSDNKMHDDAVARQFGFRGGLVPGVDVAAYMCHPPAAAWGEAWLKHGRFQARFVHPVYDGDAVTVTPELSVVDSAGTVCAVGGASLGAAASVVDLPGSAPLPDGREPASIDWFEAHPVLGSIEAGFHAEQAGEYLDVIGEQLPLFRDGGVAHPGWLLRQANYVLTANVRLGPWIHTSSDAALLGVVADGARVSTRARVVKAWEAKGHHLVQLDVAMVADGSPVMRVDHVAIFRPRAAA